MERFRPNSHAYWPGLTDGRQYVYVTIPQDFGVAFPKFFNKPGRPTVHIHPSPALILSLFDLVNFHLCQASNVSLNNFEDSGPYDTLRSSMGTKITAFLEPKLFGIQRGSTVTPVTHLAAEFQIDLELFHLLLVLSLARNGGGFNGFNGFPNSKPINIMCNPPSPFTITAIL